MTSAAIRIEKTVGRRVAPRTSCGLMVEIRGSAQEWMPALLADISTTGFKLDGIRGLRDCRSLWLRPHGMDPMPAKVRWSAGAAVGCEFLYPLDRATESALRQLITPQTKVELVGAAW